jgi:hypothetical protein
MIKVRIKKIPKARTGYQVQGALANDVPAMGGADYNAYIGKEKLKESKYITAVPREEANLEAERNETVLMNVGGIPAHFKIGGKRHFEGGTPLNLPENSFIYSDTAKMKIKDPTILAQFGMSPKKGGYTPAEIAKKYDINSYRKILADPNSDDLQRKTAELMITNNNLMLSKLSLIQESKKGFPQGIPVVGMPYVLSQNMEAAELMPQTEGQEEEPEADMEVA